MEKKEYENYGGWAFIPLLVFLGIYLGAGIFYDIKGFAEPFKQIPRLTALFVGIAIALIMGNQSFEEKMDIFTSEAGEKNILLMCVIFLLAGGFAGVAKEMGGVESTVNLGLTFIPKQFIIAGVFIISSFIALAMGTSMGTIAAIGPIAVGLADKADLPIALAIGAVVGGAMFGDNLSIISDTTIAATRSLGVKMRDKFLMNFLIALPAALISIIIYSLLGTSGSLAGPFPYDLVKVIPYLGVLIAALAGVNVLVVLISGMLLAGIIGLATGSLTIVSFAQSVGNGASGMQGLVVIALLIRGLTGLVKEHGGIDWLVNTLSKNIKTRKGAEYGISALVALVDGALANNTVAIMVTAPLAKRISTLYKIDNKKVASLLDIFSCVMQGIIPHGGQLLLAGTIAGISPILIIKNLYYPLTLCIIALISIQLNFKGIKFKENSKSNAIT